MEERKRRGEASEASMASDCEIVSGGGLWKTSSASEKAALRGRKKPCEFCPLTQGKAGKKPIRLEHFEGKDSPAAYISYDNYITFVFYYLNKKLTFGC